MAHPTEHEICIYQFGLCEIAEALRRRIGSPVAVALIEMAVLELELIVQEIGDDEFSDGLRAIANGAPDAGKVPTYIEIRGRLAGV
jgi:hypothetical protein